MNRSFELRTALARVSVCSLLALPLAGCAKGGVEGVVPVTGKVTYNGAPVAGAAVSFVSADRSAPATALTASDGTFALRTVDTPGALPGNYVALVQKSELPAELTQEVSMEDAVAQAGKPVPAAKELLPAKYADATASPLKFEVKDAGENTFELALTD